jgi:hypothetical protein
LSAAAAESGLHSGMSEASSKAPSRGIRACVDNGLPKVHFKVDFTKIPHTANLAGIDFHGQKEDYGALTSGPVVNAGSWF